MTQVHPGGKDETETQGASSSWGAITLELEGFDGTLCGSTCPHQLEDL